MQSYALSSFNPSILPFFNFFSCGTYTTFAADTANLAITVAKGGGFFTFSSQLAYHLEKFMSSSCEYGVFFVILPLNYSEKSKGENVNCKIADKL